MAYGELKCDTITFTAGGVDTSVSISGLVQNPTFTGNITTTGTITADVVIGTTLVSGATVTGTTANFVTVSGTTALGNTARFITVSGTTVTGTQANFIGVSGTTITGAIGRFTNVTGVNIVGTTLVSGATVTGNIGSFTTLTGGIVNLTSGVFASGTAAAPSVSIGTTDNGLYSPGADQVAISTNGTGRLFVDASGNVGVNTSSPSNALQIESDANSNQGVWVRNTNTGSSASSNVLINSAAGQLFLRAHSAAHSVWPATALISSSSGLTGGLALNTGTTAPIAFLTNGSERLRITSDGKVGVGTSSPGYKLDVGTTSDASNHINIKTSATGTASFYFSDTNNGQAGIDYNHSTDKLTIRSADATAITIDSSQRVGVGTTSPVGALDVNVGGTGPARIVLSQASDNPYIDFYRTDGISVFSGFRISNPSATTGALTFSTAANAAIGSHTFTERARIDSSGRLLVGTSSSVLNGSTVAGKIQVADTASAAVVSVATWVNNANGSILALGKSRSATPGSYAIVSDNDLIGAVRFAADDGTDLDTRAAEIKAEVDGTPGANDMPGRLVFSTTADGASSPTERLRIDSSGRVGIGDSAPDARLTVKSSGGSTTPLNVKNSAGTEIFRVFQTSGGGSQTSFKDSSGNTSVFIDGGAGQVGIGTTSANSRLDVVPDSGGIGVNIRNRSTDDYGYLRFQNNAGSATQASIGNLAGQLQFEVGNTERARIDSSGRLLVGTSSASATALLQVQGNQSNSGGSGGLQLCRGEAATSITSGESIGYITFSDNAGGPFGSIECVSDAAAGTNDYPGRLVFATTADGASSPTERMRIDKDGIIRINTGGVNPSASVNGTLISETGYIWTSVGGDPAAYFNRNTNDGTIVELRQANVTEGTISVSGTTVSYNGAHLSRWSQLPSGAERTEILRGSVLSNIDEMCEWGNEENEQLNRMKVSDVEGDKNVSGVFQAWDDDDDTYTNDFYCAMTGDFIIRIGAGVTVERGDLLMSAGDGTAKPQDDDIIRSKTIAKVTSTNVSCTYDDGSYCVPCVLMAC